MDRPPAHATPARVRCETCGARRDARCRTPSGRVCDFHPARVRPCVEATLRSAEWVPATVVARSFGGGLLQAEVAQACERLGLPVDVEERERGNRVVIYLRARGPVKDSERA